VRDTRRTRFLLGVALIAALALIAVSYSSRGSSLIGTMRNTAGSAFGGAERAVSGVTRPIGTFVDAGLAGTGSGQVAGLQRKIARMRAELSAAQLSKAEYAELSRMLDLAGAGSYRVVPAEVVGFGQGYQQTVTLDAGSSAGVRPQMTVLDGDGLVGQVISVTPATCTVLLASAASSVVGVRLAPAGQIGWVTGTGSAKSGSGLLKLQILDSATPLRLGQQLVTSASVNDRPFVPGVPVGVIVSVKNRAGALTAQALVRPYADFTSINIVGIVIAPPKRNPGYSVLPPKPAPAAKTQPTQPTQPTAGKSTEPKPKPASGH
jgi:rod shape-determining protein MreC